MPPTPDGIDSPAPPGKLVPVVEPVANTFRRLMRPFAEIRAAEVPALVLLALNRFQMMMSY